MFWLSDVPDGGHLSLQTMSEGERDRFHNATCPHQTTGRLLYHLIHQRACLARPDGLWRDPRLNLRHGKNEKG